MLWREITLICAINAIATFGISLLVNYLTSYIGKKGEYLATKEDISEITRRTEEVKDEICKGFALYSADLKFKYDFYYKQYSELYSFLFGVICQSEYLRGFFEKCDENQTLTFDYYPFIEISSTTRTITKTTFDENGFNAKRTQETFETDLSKFNKKCLYETIINKGQYATPKLLKLAVEYRYAYQNYSGNPDITNSSLEDEANKEEFRLIREIVCCIVSEYNFLRKQLEMEYGNVALEKIELK
ncbi:MAG: hypothetical protein LBR54_01010 [Oscillospiraceae bacterium]|jgi:hypothetical protein|nr:hypothetical protein [Oscillospiraceae bacterium]